MGSNRYRYVHVHLLVSNFLAPLGRYSVTWLERYRLLPYCAWPPWSPFPWFCFHKSRWLGLHQSRSIYCNPVLSVEYNPFAWIHLPSLLSRDYRWIEKRSNSYIIYKLFRLLNAMMVHFIYGNWRRIFSSHKPETESKIANILWSSVCLHQEHNGLAAIVEKSNLCTIDLIPCNCQVKSCSWWHSSSGDSFLSFCDMSDIFA